jgi:hypothetical protein
VEQKPGAVNMVVDGYNDRGHVICTVDEEQLELCGPEQPKRPIRPRQVLIRTSRGY